MVAYLATKATEEWQESFKGLMSGVINDQWAMWSMLLGTSFDVRNIDAEAWFQDYTLKFAQNCTLRTEETVKGMISQALEEGWSIGRMSKNLGQVFDQWINGDSSAEDFEWMADRTPYWRREMIARSETIRASNRGNEQLFARWGVEGKEWLTAHDDRLCPWCAALDGKVIKISEPFFVQGDTFDIMDMSGEQWKIVSLHLDYEDVTSPPLHPNCRCTLLPWKAEWEEFGVPPPAQYDTWEAAADAGALPEAIVEVIEEIAPQIIEEVVPPVVEEAPVVLPPFPDDLFEKYEIVKPLGGSTGANLVRDPRTGRQYVMKRGATAGHIRNEATADAMYKAMGVRVPDFRLFETDEGPVKFAEFLEDTMTLRSVMQGDDEKLREQVVRELRQGMAADALLANWDVMGLDMDNVLVDRDGHAWRIDNGGGLWYRGMGQQKTEAQFGDFPMELWTLRSQGEASAIYGSMDWYDVERSMRAMLKGRKDVQSIAAEDLGRMGQVKIEERIANMMHAQKTSSKLRRDDWLSTYTDDFVYHALNLQKEGIIDALPTDGLKRKGKTSVVDKQGRVWDNMRGRDSAMARLAEYIDTNGGDLGLVESWAKAQAGTSGSSHSQTVAYFYAHQANAADQYFWDQGQERAAHKYDLAVKRFGESFDKSYTMWHAFNYEFLQNVNFARNDQRRGIVQLVRTEPVEAWAKTGGRPDGGVGDLVHPSRRGLVSGSIYQTVTVGGHDLTMQEVPHHRLVGSYMFGKGSGRNQSFFYGDSENEFIMMTHDLDVMYMGSTSSGRASGPFWTRYNEYRRQSDQ